MGSEYHLNGLTLTEPNQYHHACSLSSYLTDFHFSLWVQLTLFMLHDLLKEDQFQIIIAF